MDRLLYDASQAMKQEHYDAAATMLGTPPLPSCDPRIDLLLGAALEGSGDSSRAEETLLQAHLQWPSNHSLAASLARSYLLSGHPAQAAEAFASTTVGPGVPPQELELRAEVYLAVHQLALAQTAAGAAYRSYPSTETLLLLANVIQTQGRALDALTLLESKREQNSESAPFLITTAECEFDTGAYARAHQDLVHAIAIDGTSYQAHYLLGNTLVKQTQIEEAIAEYQRAIDLAPDKPRTYYQLALARVMKGDVDGAEQSLSKAVAADERYAPAYAEMGELLLQQGRYSEAVDPLRKAIEFGPTLESPYYLLTRVYSRLGEKKESDDMLQRFQEVKAANLKRPVKAKVEEQSSYPGAPLPPGTLTHE